MAKLTRRGLIKQSSAGAATLGALMAAPSLATVHAASARWATDHATPALPGPLVAYVRDMAAGELALLVGAREIIVRDPGLVKRLVKAAQ